MGLLLSTPRAPNIAPPTLKLYYSHLETKTLQSSFEAALCVVYAIKSIFLQRDNIAYYLRSNCDTIISLLPIACVILKTQYVCM